MIQPISFGYKWKVKTEWLNDKLPEVTKGFYGDVLTKENVTVEHLKPVSQGGKTVQSNLVLASYRLNNLRSNKDIREFVDKDAANTYLEQFKDLKFKNFNGNEYVKQVKNTLKSLGVRLDETV